MHTQSSAPTSNKNYKSHRVRMPSAALFRADRAL
jgi:hypothetical protein